MTDAATLRVFLYLRTSTDEQDDSPEVQEKRLRDFLAPKGWEVAGVYYDIVTGKAGIEKRPQFRRMLEDAKLHGVQGFVALVWDRFLRSTRVKTYMEDRLIHDGLFIWGIDDNLGMGKIPGQGRQRAGDKAMVNMKTMMAEYYSDFVSDKIIDHHEHRVSKGLHHSGAPPFGYKPKKDAYEIDGRRYDGWVPDDMPDGSGDGMTMAERYCWIVDRFIACENMMDIAVELTTKGVPTPRLVQWNRLSQSEKARRLDVQAKNQAAGHETMQLPPSPLWDSSVLSDMLRSEAYLGRCSYTPSHLQEPGKKKTKAWYDGHHQPLNTSERHDQVLAILDRKGRDKRRPATVRDDALLNGGILRCGCGGAMTFSMRDEWRYRYRCNFQKKSRGLACQQQQICGPAVEERVFKMLLRGIKVRLAEIRAAGGEIGTNDNAGEVERQLAAEKAKKARVLDTYFAGHLDDDEEQAKLKRDALLAPILKRVAELEALRTPALTPQPGFLERTLTNIETLWADWPTSVKREILRTYAPDGFVLKGKALRGVVCGITLETEVPTGEVPGPGQRFGGRQKKGVTANWPVPAAAQAESATVATATNKVVPLPVSRGTYRSGGNATRIFPPWRSAPGALATLLVQEPVPEPARSERAGCPAQVEQHE